MFGLLRQWQATEAWAAAGKLGVLRALIREDDQPLPGGGYHGDLPEGWSKSLTHEVAAALAMPAVSAEKLMWLAWDLEARLPGIGELVTSGMLTAAKAQAVSDAMQLLGDEDAAKAEAMIVPELPGKTFGQVQRLAVQAAVTVDPEMAARGREDAERNQSRVQMFREQSGAAALSGRNMSVYQTLSANASIAARAQEYQDSGVFPKDTRMDQYRVAAYLDLLNLITAEVRIAAGTLPGDDDEHGDTPGDDDEHEDTPGDDHEYGDTPGDDEYGTPPDDDRHSDAPDGDGPDDTGPDDNGPDDNGPDDNGPDGGMPGGDGPRGGPDPGGQQDGGTVPGDDPGDGRRSGGHGESSGQPNAEADSAAPTPPRLADLVLPLATLLGLANRPGEGHGLGTLDPDLCREIALAAARSPWTRLCVTVTGQDGIAIGHGCARLARGGKRPGSAHYGGVGNSGGSGGRVYRVPVPALAALPSRVNLTVTAACLTELAGKELAATGPPGTSEACRSPGSAPWAFIRTGGSGPPGGFGRWVLALPDGRGLTVDLEPVPTFGCDHRHESLAYQPNDMLRHLVQVRDGECTFPTCSRHARESDFEHATPYDKGGRTCSCNAGARSRACHQVKQSKGWTVTQPRPGWHEWRTPSGRVYVQGPKRYPA